MGSPAPNINLVTQGGFDGYVDVFVDNIRLFNAKGNRGRPEPMDPPALTGVQSSGGQIEIEFASVSGGSYSILVSEDLLPAHGSEAAWDYCNRRLDLLAGRGLERRSFIAFGAISR